MSRIQEDKLIGLYNNGKSNIEIASFFGCAKRTIENKVCKLRSENKLKYRKELEKERKKEYNYEDVLNEVRIYLDDAKEVLEETKKDYKDIKLVAKWNIKKQNEDMGLVWSDMHTGMINRHPLTNDVTYNEEIQKKEVHTLLKGIVRFCQLYKPSYNIETLYIFDVGDNITNDRIYEGQLAEITCGVGKQILKTLEYQSFVIKELLRYFPKIVIIKVYGNHGRTTSQPISEDATNNFEFLEGQLLKERFKDNKKVEVIVPESYRYTAMIRGHKYLLFHGNTIRGATLNSIEKAVKDLSTLAYKEFYDVMIIGHFHTALKLRITPETTLLANGCFIEMDDYAYEKLRKFSTATQYLFNISNKSPLHNLQEIDLRWK